MRHETAREIERDARRADYVLEAYRRIAIAPALARLIELAALKVGQRPAGELDSR